MLRVRDIMPALRDRPSDIPLLAAHFLTKYSDENGKDLSEYSSEALDALVSYEWPGNVRELENAVERAVVLAQGPQVELSNLPVALARAERKLGGAPQIPGASLADIERYAILQTLEAAGGSTSKAAKILGISVRKIQYKLQEYRSAPKSNLAAVEKTN